MKKVIIFISGSGSNAENIYSFFKNNKTISVVGIFTNNPKSSIFEQFKKINLPIISFNRETFYKTNFITLIIESINPSLIILAGFLWKFPNKYVLKYPNKILNIHPSLLPKYGGKGMYGLYVHKAVIENNELESGITIHYVNEYYDKGSILFQKTLKLENDETPTTLQKKIQKLEHHFFPEVIQKLLNEKD